MPAEWEPHEGTWLAWPKDPITWPDRVPQVEKVYLQMIAALSQGEKVFLLVDDEATAQKINLPNVFIYQIPTVDSWIRDYGPNFLVRKTGTEKELAFNHWIFNAWGEKYAELMLDTQVPEQIRPLLNVSVFEPKIVLEGGSIDVNGTGLCLTTKQCLLNANRNPQLKQAEIEKYLINYLNLEKIIWLEEGLEGDDTDGHIDDIARFVSHDTVVCVIEENPKDKNTAALQTNLKILQRQNLKVIPLPMPGTFEREGRRLPASYANFYIGNTVVLVPTFQHSNDAKVVAILQKLFPDRKIVGVDCSDLIWGMGAIHCVTQQQPAAQQKSSI